jgi:DNA ligase-1
MLLADVVAASQAVAATSARLQKIGILAELLKRVPQPDAHTVLALLSGSTRQGRMGIGPTALQEASGVAAADEPTLTVADVDEQFERIGAASGEGSARAKEAALGDLLRRATRDEQSFLTRLLFGELRQGALEGVLLEAIAKATGIAAPKLRRAAMVAGSLPIVGVRALTGGDPAVDALVLRPLHPVQPMLAESVGDVGEALVALGEPSFEYKLDGARIQAHKHGDEIRIYSRTLRDVTPAVPEVVEAVRRLPAAAVVLDGEAIALRADGMPQPFQQTMRRFGRKLDVERLRDELPIAPYFFDCLYVDDQPLVDDPLHHRFAALAAIAPPEMIVPRLVTRQAEAAREFYDRAIRAGHEGLVAKTVDAAYAAGRRGQAWLKIKRVHTLDLVVLAVEWGSGRRRGMLSNLHLGARDAGRGGFVMLGKTFKGLTDEMLAWQTRALLDLEVARDAHTIHVRPELVVEVAFNDIQESPQYPGRLALRFARVRRYRPDKTAVEADTFRTVQEIYRQLTGIDAPEP